MLALVARHGRGLEVLPRATQSLAVLLQQERGMKLFEIFSKEERHKRKALLKEEMQRGYFDDFREFRDSKGKVFMAPERLVPATHAPEFPQIQVVQSDGHPATFPPTPPGTNEIPSSSSSGGGGINASQDAGEAAAEAGSSSGQAARSGLQPAAASLVCVAFRAGAQPMLEAWAAPFSQKFQGRGEVVLYELAIVEGVVMRMWPFRQLLLRNGASNAAKYAMPCRHVHHFGDMQALRKSLHLTNLLTGYVFLLDSRGRVRWRGSGSPSQQELQTLVRCTDELLQTDQQRQQKLQAQHRRQQQQAEQG